PRHPGRRREDGQITALTDLPDAARTPLSQLHAALAHDDPAELIHPLHAALPYLTGTHPDLAAQLDTLRTERVTDKTPTG
ncbi:hypothetical protein AB0D38_48980, partial [Streptomyces sp. NPDC048279]